MKSGTMKDHQSLKTLYLFGKNPSDSMQKIRRRKRRKNSPEVSIIG